MPTSRCRGDGPVLLPREGQEFHPARISLPARIRRALSRQASGADDRLRAGGLVVSLRQPARRPLRLLVPADAHRMLGADDDRGAEAQTARFRFATCGGALLRVNGEEVACARALSAQFRGGGGGRCPAGRRREPRRGLVRRPLRARRALLFRAVAAARARGFRSRCRSPSRRSGRRRSNGCSPGMRFERPFYRRRRGRDRCCREPAAQDSRCRVEVTRRLHVGREASPSCARVCERGETRLVARHGRDASRRISAISPSRSAMAASR